MMADQAASVIARLKKQAQERGVHTASALTHSPVLLYLNGQLTGEIEWNKINLTLYWIKILMIYKS